MSVTCGYCGGAAELVTGAELYGYRLDLADKKFWMCRPCKAWVGCHDGTDKPLGRLADLELRRAKAATYHAFDRLWKRKWVDGRSRRRARSLGYEWLARQLGITREACHIGMFDLETCRRAIEICNEVWRKTKPTRREPRHEQQ